MSLAALIGLRDPEVADAWASLSLGYGASRGSDLLRREVADTYGSVDADQVHCFAGATEGLARVVASVSRSPRWC